MKKGGLDFAVEAIDVVKLDIAERPDGMLEGHDLISPYVWEGEGGIKLLAPVLTNPLGATDPTAVIYAGQSGARLTFPLDKTPATPPRTYLLDAAGIQEPAVLHRHKRLL